MRIKDLIEKGRIEIKDYLITIPINVIDSLNVLNRDTKINIDFWSELEEYLDNSEYNECRLVPLYGGGLDCNLNYKIALVPNMISEVDTWEWFKEHIQGRL